MGEGSIRNRALQPEIRETHSGSEKDYIGSRIKTAAEKIISVQQSSENTDNKNPAALSGKRKKAGNPVQLELFF